MMTEKERRRLMLPTEIADFVDDVVKAGCDICAVGHHLYVIGDADLTDKQYEMASPHLDRINERYGDRDFLRLEIVAYLRSLGRYLDPGSPRNHWSKNEKALQ